MALQNSRDRQMRQRIALEAARIMEDSGLRDFQIAKRKAAERLGAPDTRNLPSNQEIEDAFMERQRLFHGDTQPARVRQLRGEALKAMEFFAPFEPRLVGPVLQGTASDHSDVQLHLFAATPEEVVIYLMDQNIPFEQGERRLRFGRDRYESYPVYRFVAGSTVLDLTVFPVDGSRQAPCSPVDGRPMQRATASQVQDLLAEEQTLEL